MKILENQIEKTSNNSLKNTLKEVNLTYETGAFQASLILLWVAVQFDIINKIENLGDQGDKPCKELISRLEKIITNNNKVEMQKLENSLLAFTKDSIKLINHREHEELTRLQADRNLCAHPAFLDPGNQFRPSAELVSMHIKCAVEAVFSKHLFSGKVIIEQFEKDISLPSWPLSSVSATYFMDRYVEKVNETAGNNLTKVVIKNYIKENYPESSKERCERNYRNLLTQLFSSRPEKIEKSLNEIIVNFEKNHTFEDSYICRLISLFGHTNRLWDMLPDTVMTRAQSLFSSENTDYLVDSNVFGGDTDFNLPWDKDGNVIESIINSLELSHLSKVSVFHNLTINKILDAIRDSITFRDAESKLELLSPHAPFLMENHIEKLDKIMMSNSQVRIASAAEGILISILKEWSVKPSLVKSDISPWVKLQENLNSRGKSNTSEYDSGYLYEKLGEEISNISDNLF